MPEKNTVKHKTAGNNLEGGLNSPVPRCCRCSVQPQSLTCNQRSMQQLASQSKESYILACYNHNSFTATRSCARCLQCCACRAAVAIRQSMNYKSVRSSAVTLSIGLYAAQSFLPPPRRLCDSDSSRSSEVDDFRVV